MILLSNLVNLMWNRNGNTRKKFCYVGSQMKKFLKRRKKHLTRNSARRKLCFKRPKRETGKDEFYGVTEELIDLPPEVLKHRMHLFLEKLK